MRCWLEREVHLSLKLIMRQEYECENYCSNFFVNSHQGIYKVGVPGLFFLCVGYFSA